MPAVDLEALLADPPATHIDGDGRPVPWEIARQVLDLIDAHVTEDSSTLETGAGLSTALFAVRGARHTCIVPWTSEIERLRTWADRTGVSLDRVRFECGLSEDVLPGMDRSALDFVLIDGGHGFPTPFVDFHYAGRRLRRGGLLAIDDTQLWTGRVLHRFLKEQPGWEIVKELPMRSTVFRRTEEPSDRIEDWVDQPYVVRRSFSHGPRGLVRKAFRGAGRARDAIRARR
jgi:hypothetical protein